MERKREIKRESRGMKRKRKRDIKRGRKTE